MDYLNTCPLCKKDYYGPHYCGGVGVGGLRIDYASALVPPPLTEEDVRRIVRDELARTAASRPSTENP